MRRKCGAEMTQAAARRYSDRKLYANALHVGETEYAPRPSMKLDTTSLGNAVRRLREGLARYQREPMDEQIRDGLIPRFEFTYELSHKMLRRYLKETAASPDEVERMPFADLIRTGQSQGLLLSAWPAWRRFREMRARTSHTYDAKVASQVTSAIPAFVEEAEHLYTELQRRLA